MDSNAHRALTIDQFTQQAIPFANLPGHSTSLDLLVGMSAPTSSDHVLDVACGPGIVACHFAPRVAHVSGIDLTPAMIDAARQAQARGGFANMSWHIGPADALPFADGTFTLVITRYSLHHLQQPAAVIAEMVRVLAPGGRLQVADMVQPAAKAPVFDELERLRDPSHVHALSREELAMLLAHPQLLPAVLSEYKVEMALEDQLAASFPPPGGAERFRELLRADVGVDRHGTAPHWVDGELHYAIPIAAAVAVKRG